MIRVQNSAKQEQWPFLDADKPGPFEELLAPLVVVARQRFAARCETASLLLDEAAQLSLQRHLLQMLTSLALDTLYSEFVRVREQVGTNVPTS
ncbi:MAG TPA: hypothetical protein VFV38_19045, partial [Ktedonobacteraceae bacterium]|nr:hypothetical protein [Ktedonobacteraceae bacterium]